MTTKDFVRFGRRPESYNKGALPLAVLTFMRTHTLGLTALVLLAGLSTSAQQNPPPKPLPEQPPVTFKVEVNYVEIDAIVTDQQGNVVRNLTKDDFVVTEQGKPQTVSIASLVDIPVEKFDPPLYKTKPIEPDVRSNRKEFNGRVFVIVLDDQNTAFTRTARVKAAARLFIERYLGANDVAAIVQTGGSKSTSQEFTSSRERLLRAVNNFMGNKERSGTLERIDEYYRTLGTSTGGRPNDPNEAVRVYKARNTFSVLKNVADYMAGIRGRRKAVVLFSEGIDYDIYNPIANTYASDIRQYGQDAIAAATRANVSFYGVDPRGLSAFDDAAEIASLPNDPSLNLGLSALQDELRISQDSLRTLSDETGGFAAVNSNDFGTAFERIIRDNSSYYVLGYYSTDGKRDGGFRNLTVRVKQPGMQVRARKGYVAPRGRPPAGTAAPAGIAASVAMREALDSPVPVTGLSMSAFAAPMMGAKPNASVLVVIEVDGQALKFKQDGPVFANNIEVAILAMDESGKVQEGSKDTAELKLRAETQAAVAKNGIRMTKRLNLPPGRYQLRIGARESVGSLVGSVMYDLDVPDFSKQELSMGGVLLTSASSSRMPTANPDADFKEILPGSPTAMRDFPTGDQLALAVDVYDNKVSSPHRVNIHTSITADDGNVVFTSNDERKSDELKGVNGTYGHVATIPLKGVAPGRYVLRVEAKSTLSSNATASREVEFTGTVMADIETIARGEDSRLVELRRFVIRDRQAFAAIWAAHAGPNAIVPVVDFETRMVAAVFSGTRPTPGYGIEITGTTAGRLGPGNRRRRAPAGPVAGCRASDRFAVSRRDAATRRRRGEIQRARPARSAHDCLQEPAPSLERGPGGQSSGPVQFTRRRCGRDRSAVQPHRVSRRVLPRASRILPARSQGRCCWRASGRTRSCGSMPGRRW